MKRERKLMKKRQKRKERLLNSKGILILLENNFSFDAKGITSFLASMNLIDDFILSIYIEQFYCLLKKGKIKNEKLIL